MQRPCLLSNVHYYFSISNRGVLLISVVKLHFCSTLIEMVIKIHGRTMIKRAADTNNIYITLWRLVFELLTRLDTMRN